jgi:hypothetical protein
MRASAMLRTAAVAVVLLATSAAAQRLTKGVLSGTVQSHGVTVLATSTGTVFTTPATGFIIVTQWCSDFTAGTLAAGTLELPRTGNAAAGNERCTSYVPGVVLPPSTAVTFMNPGSSSQAVTVTGVLSSN